jgi:hypothetical protein
MKNKGKAPHYASHPYTDTAKADCFQILVQFWLRYSAPAIIGLIIDEDVEVSETGNETALWNRICEFTSIFKLTQPVFFADALDPCHLQSTQMIYL